MPGKRLLIVTVATLAASSILLAAAAPVWAASREKVVHSFNGKDGSYPYSGVISDSAGNLYGTTAGDYDYPCSYGCGTVFKLARDTQGKWTRTVLHRFSGNDGANPFAGLIFDGAGNLYGATWIGGKSKGCGSGCGTIFKLSPAANGKWTETVLHSFNGYEGANPNATPIFDGAGNLYGTTFSGGVYGCGNVFKLEPGDQQRWTETVLHTFNCKDGNIVYAGLIFDTQGNLYGATGRGGASDNGTVFRLTPSAKGKWSHTVLHSFHGKDGVGPTASLVFDSMGNLYGTTQLGGDLRYCSGYGCGTVFRLAPDAKGKWTETVLHAFKDKDGAYPNGRLSFDGAGNLYGTTTGDLNYGTVFRLAPGGNGKWTETVLRTFNSKDGSYPVSNVIFGAAGDLFGTTTMGGNLSACSRYQGNGCGVVFEITP
jgi:uncharacterized repeat protein (TIGR03803 family)